MSSINKFTNPTKFKDQLTQFILENGVISTTAGVSIALVTKDVIQSLVGDIIIPSIIFILTALHIKSLTDILPGKKMIDLTNFLKNFITWILVVIITFIFITITFQQILGAQKPVNDKK
jgi:large-conductance mechanosensitive channel